MTGFEAIATSDTRLDVILRYVSSADLAKSVTFKALISV